MILTKLKNKIINLASGKKKKVKKIQTFPDDIWLVSYPKSGNTWLRFIIANYLTNNQCNLKSVNRIVPDIHYNANNCLKIERPRFIKSHLPFTPDYKKVVYLVRDGRDVAVSYYFHLMKFRNIPKSTEFADFVKKFNQGSVGHFSSWSNHVNSWLDHQPEQFMLVKYEDLKTDIVAQMTQILDFAGITIDDFKLKSAIEASHFDQMKSLEQKQQHEFKALANSDTDIPFMRSGKAGEWEKFFNDNLHTNFLKINSKALKRLNYLS